MYTFAAPVAISDRHGGPNGSAILHILLPLHHTDLVVAIAFRMCAPPPAMSSMHNVAVGHGIGTGGDLHPPGTMRFVQVAG